MIAGHISVPNYKKNDHPWRWRVLWQVISSHFDFGHVVVVKELGLAIIPSDPHARPIAGCDGALISQAVMPSDALPDSQFL